MSLFSRYVIILVVSLSCAVSSLAVGRRASLQDKTSKKATGSVSGRVTVKGKGEAGIIVGLWSAEMGSRTGPFFKAMTDVDGNYRIADLPAGNYQVSPIAPAFVISDVNSFGMRGKRLILNEGEEVQGIDFSMDRGGVVTGKVTLADGRPAVEERVNVVPAEQTDHQMSMTSSGTVFQTDDRGIYRVFGLPSGKYKIFVGQGSDTFFGRYAGRPMYARTFYTDIANPAEPKVVEVGEGAEATNIDITIAESIKGFAATAIVIDSETNKPIANLRFGLQKVSGERTDFISPSVQSDRLGKFRFENLQPGKYSIVNMPQPNSDMRGDSVPFEIVDQDVTGLMVKALRGASLSGTLVIEGIHKKNVESKITQFRLHAYNRSEAGGSGFVEWSPINSDGSFRISGMQAGVAQFHLSAQDRSLMTGYFISSVEREGVVVPGGVEIRPGEQISGLRVIVGFASGTIKGTVKLESGPLPTGSRVSIRLVNPADPSFFQHPEVDARGRFILEGIPAGSYDLHVYTLLPGSRPRQSSTRRSVIVTEGTVSEVEVMVDLEPTPTPRP